MSKENHTGNSGFVLLGLSTQPEHQQLLALLFLSMYLLTLLGNLLTVLLIRSDAHLLHTPMYFFLSHLSLADVGFASATLPKLLQNLLFQVQTISYSGCLTQMYSYMAFGNTDSFLLASMAYDRYVAICHPLHYTALMSHKRCLLLVASCWLLASLHSLLYTVMMSRLSFCSSREIPQFFCEIYPLLGLACSDTSTIETTALIEGFLDVLGPFVLIVISYGHIFYTILNVPSANGKRKAFSTCGSHLGVVILFYGTLCWVYLQPSSRSSDQKNIVASLMYTVVTPLLNPFIYTLRNNDMKAAFRRLVSRVRSFQGY
ncbi:olfactory receptor 1E5-like [Hemicordylus capensis]|uniref:olfactory receptor 1E5-like n=1 Tax=Hemicordylus capensis TaxID=884348 RepID=UPI0023046E44|nr:olfactory receptor 1E5-like [Hemicordylus capensis]